MTAREGDASPRGIEFLFSRNRLNVAISRARILAILVASPKLARTRCSRLDQLRVGEPVPPGRGKRSPAHRSHDRHMTNPRKHSRAGACESKALTVLPWAAA